MAITSIYFGLFIIGSLLVYYLVNHKYRMILLSVLSLLFIGTFSVKLVAYILFFTLINFFIGKKTASDEKKIYFRIGIAFNLLQLILLRYSVFLLDPAFVVLGADFRMSVISDLIVPVGVSYYTLQGIGYLFNIKMGWEKPESQFFNFLVFITFFPKFLSGPIERSNHFLPQLKEAKSFDIHRITGGLKLILYGLFKKVVIANQIAPFLTAVYSNIDSVNSSALWLLIIIQPLCLYFDFSGYTDMAIGVAKLFGIDLLPNFNKPFFAENMTTFWKRFHISLSSWFNDYIFKQASFRYRKWGVYSSIYALLLTWILFGIWHGAGWNFMLLGLIQALAIIYEFFTRKWRIKVFGRIPHFPRLMFSRLITFLFYGTSLVFFFSPDIHTTIRFFSNLPGAAISATTVELPGLPLYSILLMLIVLIIEYISNDFEVINRRITDLWMSKTAPAVLIKIGVYLTMILMIYFWGTEGQEFIYAQF